MPIQIDGRYPVYDTNTNTLTYTITGENGTAVEIPSEFGQSILVVDSVLAGVHPIHIHL